MHTFVRENIEVKRFIKYIPQIQHYHVQVHTHTHTHTHWGLWAGMFSRQTSESGSSELNFHVVWGPGELVYRAENQPRSFNYRLSVASECVATSLNGKWDEAGNEGRERAHRAAVIVSCIDLKTFLSGSCCLSHSPPCKCEICSDLGNQEKYTWNTLWCPLMITQFDALLCTHK